MEYKEKKLRIGKINYTNSWPIFQYFPYEFFEEEVEWVEKVPAQLNRALAEGELDLAAISAFAYAQHADHYLLLPQLSVSAHRHVKSILLFHKRPLRELDGKQIALTNTSATSVNLLKILMEKHIGCRPSYFYNAPDLDKMMEKAEAALLIGDDAIRNSWRHHDYEVTDLGNLWFEYTNQWMSYAVWAVRKQVVDDNPELLERIFHGFLSSKEMNASYPQEVVQQAVQKIGGTSTYWEAYFSNLCYDFNEEQQQGLSKYYELAYDLGYLDRPVELQFWSNKTLV